MSKTVLHIKNMVCPRCIKVISVEFEKLHIPIQHIELGRLETPIALNSEQITHIQQILEDNGFELIDDKNGKVIERIKTLIIEKIHHSEEALEGLHSSDYFASEITKDYSYISNLFSSVAGITIEKYIINQKIEKAKELLAYNELSLKEIAFKLGYSSVQHLSSQFKKVTGLTPSHFKTLKDKRRKALDDI